MLPWANCLARWLADLVRRRHAIGVDYQLEHHQLQAILATELQDYGPHPLSPKDADEVAWHLADVTLKVVIDAVGRERGKRVAEVTDRLVTSETSPAGGHRWWRRIVT
jgi:hypothetical protein